MSRVCPTCGAESGAAAVHCRGCGVKLPELATGLTGVPSPSRGRSFWRAAFWALVLLAVGGTGFWAKGNIEWRKSASWVADAAHGLYLKWMGDEPKPAPPPPPSVSVLKIRCQLCGGLGYEVKTEDKTDRGRSSGVGGSPAGPRPSTDTPVTRKVACVLCGQNGGRTIILPVGAEVCPACNGMGKIVGVVHGNTASSICKMCEGKGYLVRKY